MKVLHVCASLSPEWGGPVAVVFDLLPALRDCGVSSTVIAPTGRRVGSDSVWLEGVDSRLFPTGQLARAWTGYAPRMAKEIRQSMPDHDLVHIHELWHYPHYAASRAARAAGKPYVVTVHGEMNPWSLGQKRLKKWIYMRVVQMRILDRAEAVHAVTAKEEQHIRAQGVRAPITVIPNGINGQTFNNFPAGRPFIGKFPDLNGKRIILFLGRIHPHKGLDLLAQAFARLAIREEDVRLVIVGPDEASYRRTIEALLRTGGVLDRTLFTGMLTGDDKLAAYAAADVFVLPSHGEVIGVSTLEALAAGLPVVITRQCQFPEVAEAEAGLVVNPDPDEIHDALIKVLLDPEKGRAMGARGRQLVLERYTWDAVAERMARLYKSVLTSTTVDVMAN